MAMEIVWSAAHENNKQLVEILEHSPAVFYDEGQSKITTRREFRDGSTNTKSPEAEKVTQKHLKYVQEKIIESWWELRPSTPVLYNALKGSPFYDIFVERFIDDFAPDNHCFGRSDAIRAAGEIRMFSPLLTDAFQAASTIHFGQAVGDWRALSAGHIIYGRVLQRLKLAVVHPEQSRSEGLLAAVCILMALESLRNSSSIGPLAHCIGALQLMEYRGPYSHKYGMEHLVFTELLPYWVYTAIYLRKPSFLGTRDWKTIPWSGEGAKKDIMAELLEHVVDIPGILFHHDLLCSRTTSHLEKDFLDRQNRLWEEISDVESRLRNWKLVWADAYPLGTPFAMEFQSREHFPVFQYRDPFTSEIITPAPLIYPDPVLPRVLCVYYAAMIILASVDTRTTNTINHSKPISKYEAFSFACLICRSMKYYFDSVPGNMINRMAFPFSVAYSALPEGGVERDFAQEVGRMIQTRKKLSSWLPMLQVHADTVTKMG